MILNTGSARPATVATKGLAAVPAPLQTTATPPTVSTTGLPTPSTAVTGAEVLSIARLIPVLTVLPVTGGFTPTPASTESFSTAGISRV